MSTPLDDHGPARVETLPLRPRAAPTVPVSHVGLGCNTFGGTVDPEDAAEIVAAALDAGITFFDTADVYGRFGTLPGRSTGLSETILGAALGGRRERVVLATKFGQDMRDDYDGSRGERLSTPAGESARGSKGYIRRAIEASLTRLETGYIDLYYYHRHDGSTPITDTLAALAELIDEGLVRAVGVSNVTAAELTAAHRAAQSLGVTQLIAVQNSYNLLNRSAGAGVLDVCRELGIALIPYFPLAHGLLTGKYRRDAPPPQGSRLEHRAQDRSDDTLRRVERLEDFAYGCGHSLLDLAISGLVCEGSIGPVIAGATSPGQVRANFRAAEWLMSDEERAQLDRLTAEW